MAWSLEACSHNLQCWSCKIAAKPKLAAKFGQSKSRCNSWVAYKSSLLVYLNGKPGKCCQEKFSFDMFVPHIFCSWQIFTQYVKKKRNNMLKQFVRLWWKKIRSRHNSLSDSSESQPFNHVNLFLCSFVLRYVLHCCINNDRQCLPCFALYCSPQ